MEIIDCNNCKMAKAVEAMAKELRGAPWNFDSFIEEQILNDIAKRICVPVTGELEAFAKKCLDELWALQYDLSTPEWRANFILKRVLTKIITG